MNTELIGQYVTVSRAKMQTNILASKLTETLGWKRCKTLCLVKYHQWTGDLFCWHQTVIFFVFVFVDVFESVQEICLVNSVFWYSKVPYYPVFQIFIFVIPDPRDTASCD